MMNCTIEEPLSILQYQKESYMICPIHDGQSLLTYWYSVLSKETYKKLLNSETVYDYEKFEDELTDKAIDIRKLKNYNTEVTMSQILFKRKEVIVPIIREAVRKGYIQPLKI